MEADLKAGLLPPFERLLHEAPAIIYVYDLIEARSLYQNRELGEMLGYSECDDRPHDWQALIHPDDASRFPEHCDRMRHMRPGESVMFEYRVRDASGEWRWMISRDVPLSLSAAGQVTQVLGTATDATERRRSEERQTLLAREMNHRVKNLLGIVQSIIIRTHRTQDPADFLEVVTARLQALAVAADLLLEEHGTGVPLATVIETSLESLPHLSGRITFEGPPVELPPGLSLTLALVMNELATNAVKYGALSDPGGRVALAWKREDGRALVEWSEHDGPPVAVPIRKGFGSELIERALSEHRGAVALDFDPRGLRCTFRLPILGT